MPLCILYKRRSFEVDIVFSSKIINIFVSRCKFHAECYAIYEVFAHDFCTTISDKMTLETVRPRIDLLSLCM